MVDYFVHFTIFANQIENSPWIDWRRVKGIICGLFDEKKWLSLRGIIN